MAKASIVIAWCMGTSLSLVGGQLKRELGDEVVVAGKRRGGRWETKGLEMGDEGVGAGKQWGGRKFTLYGGRWENGGWETVPPVHPLLVHMMCSE